MANSFFVCILERYTRDTQVVSLFSRRTGYDVTTCFDYEGMSAHGSAY